MLNKDFENIKEIILEPTIKDMQSNLSVQLKGNSLDSILEEVRGHYCYYRKSYCKELEETSDGKLDRHKLGACLGGAIILTQPFLTVQNNKIIADNFPNELLAFWTSLKLMEIFMVAECDTENRLTERFWVMNNYPSLPLTTQDKRPYLPCAIYALADTRMKSKSLGDNSYDFLGNADRLFHIEQYNMGLAKEFSNKVRNGEIKLKLATA